MGSAGFGAGSLQGSGTRGKIPPLLSCPPLPPRPFSPLPQRGFVESADCRAFFFLPTLLRHSIWCLFCCAASCWLHLNTVGVSRWMFWQVDAVERGPCSPGRGPAGSSYIHFCWCTTAGMRRHGLRSLHKGTLGWPGTLLCCRRAAAWWPGGGPVLSFSDDSQEWARADLAPLRLQVCCCPISSRWHTDTEIVASELLMQVGSAPLLILLVIAYLLTLLLRKIRFYFHPLSRTPFKPQEPCTINWPGAFCSRTFLDSFQHDADRISLCSSLWREWGPTFYFLQPFSGARNGWTCSLAQL